MSTITENPETLKASDPPTPKRRQLGVKLLGYPYTDLGNAERLVAMCGRNIRYCQE
jgi:hypothetical protein